jgi:hypothetical protein
MQNRRKDSGPKILLVTNRPDQWKTMKENIDAVKMVYLLIGRHLLISAFHHEVKASSQNGESFTPAGFQRTVVVFFEDKDNLNRMIQVVLLRNSFARLH